MDIQILESINWDLLLRISRALIFVFISYFIFVLFSRSLRRKILKRVKGKKNRSNVKIFFQSLNYIVLALLVMFGALSVVGSVGGIGIAAGLFSASLGWALQRPITGFAAWIMIVLKRPFDIGDRIIVAGIKGDVLDISLTHIHIGEIGGTIKSEESSGRVILIPNSILFEQNITNYTLKNEEILDVVRFLITFDSDLRKAEELAVESAKETMKEYEIEGDNLPYIREFFNDNGIEIQLRYYTKAFNREEISSQITKKLIEKINTTKGIRFAYPHREVVMNK